MTCHTLKSWGRFNCSQLTFFLCFKVLSNSIFSEACTGQVWIYISAGSSVMSATWWGPFSPGSAGAPVIHIPELWSISFSTFWSPEHHELWKESTQGVNAVTSYPGCPIPYRSISNWLWESHLMSPLNFQYSCTMTLSYAHPLPSLYIFSGQFHNTSKSYTNVLHPCLLWMLHLSQH